MTLRKTDRCHSITLDLSLSGRKTVLLKIFAYAAKHDLSDRPILIIMTISYRARIAKPLLCTGRFYTPISFRT